MSCLDCGTCWVLPIGILVSWLLQISAPSGRFSFLCGEGMNEMTTEMWQAWIYCLLCLPSLSLQCCTEKLYLIYMSPELWMIGLMETYCVLLFPSADSSQEYTDSTGIDVHEFLVNTLKNNPRYKRHHIITVNHHRQWYLHVAYCKQ